MKTAKRLSAVVLALLMIFTALPVCFAEEDSKPVYLLLGDSIAEGYGVKNSSEACYGRIIADTLDYEYVNYGRAASTSDDLLAKIDASYVRRDIERADIISISIGGNDYLCDDKVVGLAFSALLNVNMGHFNEITDNFYENFSEIIAKIRELNPDAEILVQTVYSSWHGLPGIPYGRCTDAVNSSIEKYLDENPGAFDILDVATVFEGRKDLIADDTIHPNAEGNVVLAQALLDRLNELGVTDKTELTVNAEGENYNYYVWYIGNKPIGLLVTFLIKLLTFNLF